ncbi:MAG: HAD family hydrolase, partial [Nanoarchaeota archaeon]
MKNRKIKAVIFDLGDTLIKQKVSFYKRLKRSYDIKVELDLFRKVFSKLFHTKSWEDTNNVMKKLAKICKLENNPSFLKYLEHLFINQKYFYVKFSGTERLLKELNNNDYKTAMITNWNQGCMDVIEHHNLKDYFYHIAISAYEGIKKPDPKLFRRVLRRLKVKPSEALMVGDSHDHDYFVAKRLGMHALLLERKEKKHSHSI